MAEQKQQNNQKDYEEEIQWPDLDKMSDIEVRSELLEQRQQYELTEKEMFKKQTQIRKFEQQVKQLQEINQAQKVNTNNTSSAFTLPSEFKKLWDELVSDLMLDSFPDFLDDFQLFVGFVQQLFITVRQDLLLTTKKEMVKSVAISLNLCSEDADQSVLAALEKKLQGVFQDNSAKIFDFSEARLKQFTDEKFKPKGLQLLKSNEQLDEKQDMFLENVDSPDFIRFVRAIVKLQLHMVLNEPPIEMSLQPVDQRASINDSESGFLNSFEFWLFNKTDYYCIDGFPREGNPCVVVLPPPYRQGYVYQGIKPAVIVLSENEVADCVIDFENLCTHVQGKQEEVLAKIKKQRASSLVLIENELSEEENDKIDSRSKEDVLSSINITQIKLDSATKHSEAEEEKTQPVNHILDEVVFNTNSVSQFEEPLETEAATQQDRFQLETEGTPVPASPVVRKNSPCKLNVRSASGGNLQDTHANTLQTADKELSSPSNYKESGKKNDDSIISLTMLNQPQNRLATSNQLGPQLAQKVIESERRQYKREKTNSRSSSENKKDAVTGLNMLTASISNSSSASIIAEMHFQRGMNDIRQDLQRKIYSYQSILKKTHAAAEKRKADKMGALEASICQDASTPDESNYSYVGTEIKKDQERPGPKFFNEPQNKAGSSQIQRKKQPTQVETGCKATSQSKQVQKQSGSKDTLQHLKTAYFSKMQSLNAKLENDRAMHRKQLERSRHRTNSRSKSPLQQGRNLPRQIPQAKVLAGGKMTGVGIAKKMSKGSSKERVTGYVQQRKPSKNMASSHTQKRKYSQPGAPRNAHTNNLRSDDAPTASSNSSISSQFDDTDTEDADEALLQRKEAPTSLEDLAYEPISRLRNQCTPNAIEDSISSGSDEDDELVRRPGITQTFYQPDFKRIESTKQRGYGQESARLAEGIYQPPKQLYSYHNQNSATYDLRSAPKYQAVAQNNHHPLRYSPSTVKKTPTLGSKLQYPRENAIQQNQPTHTKLLSPKQIQQVARRTREAYSKHQKRVSSGSRQPNSSNEVRGGGGGSLHQVQQKVPSANSSVIGQHNARKTAPVSKSNRERDDYTLRNLKEHYPTANIQANQQTMQRSNSSRFYQQAAYQQPQHHAHIRTTQPFHHQMNSISLTSKQDHSPALHGSHSSKGILVNNFF